jgi:putative ABC transport system permease protein
MIVNESFPRMMGWSEPAAGNKLTGVNDTLLNGLEVIGVVKDFHYMPLQQEIQPLVIFAKSPVFGSVLVRIAPANILATIDFLHSVWKEIAPNTPFEYDFLDEAFRRAYESEMNWKTIVEYSAIFAISLACLGLLGLATLSVVNRTKEIGIRKVLGASSAGVVELLSRDFIKLVLIANLIGLPIAYLALHRWLQNFAYRIDIGWWMFALAGGLALLIAFVTVSTQAIKAALANPVEALRHE